MVQELSNDIMQRTCNSIFTEGAHESRSDKYKYINTMVVVNILRDTGWYPTQVQQVKSKTTGYQKHLIRFKKKISDNNFLTIGDNLYPEIVLINSHNGTCAYQLHAGVFRMVCANGMIISDSSFATIKIRHMGFNPEQIVNASSRVLENVDKISCKVDEFKAIELSPEEQFAYAKSAYTVKYPDVSIENARPNELLRLRRSEDNGINLWNTYNIVQENLMKGKVRDTCVPTTAVNWRGTPNNRYVPAVRYRKSRAVTNIDKNIKLNKALWTLTEEMAKLKTN